MIHPEPHCFELLRGLVWVFVFDQAADSGAGGVVNIPALGGDLVAGLIIYVFVMNTSPKTRCDSQEPICDSVSAICDKEAPDL